VAAGANPVQITRGIEKTAKALVEELRKLSKEVEDSELADVAAVSAGNNYEIGNMIAEAMNKVGRKGVVTLKEGRSSENFLYVVEGMQFERGYISPYFVTDSEKMTAEYENCKVAWNLSYHFDYFFFCSLYGCFRLLMLLYLYLHYPAAFGGQKDHQRKGSYQCFGGSHQRWIPNPDNC